MAEKTKKPKKERGSGRIAQLKAAYRVTKRGDPRIGWILIGCFVVAFGAFLGIGFLLGSPVFFGILAVMAGTITVMLVFTRRAEQSVYRQAEGQPGATLTGLKGLRRGFTILDEPIAATRAMDLVFRVVGKCGVVLVSEGPPARVQGLLAAEHRRYARVLGDLPVTEIQAGTGEGQVPIRKLSRKIMRIPRVLSGPQMTELDQRLKALAVNQRPLPIPKGPLPKGVKVPRAPR
jgi:Domain of unknown function (DUF4191)